jgi:hypothetical protein
MELPKLPAISSVQIGEKDSLTFRGDKQLGL